MAENGAPIIHKPEDKSHLPPNPFSPIISKFTEVLSLLFPPSPPAKVETVSNAAGDAVSLGSEVAEDTKPVSVRFPVAPTTDGGPLKLESEEMEKDTNPAVLWQVYAIGGFFIMKWALARWKERRINKKPSNEDSPTPPTAEDNE
ncbi:uncharacterized protein [Rutidosis leptorrhynchoides]|uniref:uncharacterized protein n=1 Tax=Rutidosis leptorrhynchoides TaxID=125765 RepID=UPI003A98EAF3